MTQGKMVTWDLRAENSELEGERVSKKILRDKPEDQSGLSALNNPKAGTHT